MNKTIITMIVIITVILAIMTAIVIFNEPEESKKSQTIVTELAEEIIEDECTEEYEEMQKTTIAQANSEEIKTSPNCSIVLKKHYTKCDHTLTEYLNLPNDLVNSTEEEIQDVYQGWNIESFKSNEIILSRDIDNECGEHYIVKDESDKVSIYRILENGKEEVVEKTDISTEYLPKVDKDNMKTGIKANGKQELNEVLENFE